MNLRTRKNSQYPAILSAVTSQENITVNLNDGRELSIPLKLFPALQQASSKQRNNLQISPSGYGIYWPELDEDISVKAFLE